MQILIESQHHTGYYKGYSQLWLGNKSVGTIEDYIYINSYLLNGLDRMIAAPQLDHLTGASSEEKFNYFMNRDKDLNDFESDKFKINFGTMSDAFTIRAYRRLNELVIFWKCGGTMQIYNFPIW